VPRSDTAFTGRLLGPATELTPGIDDVLPKSRGREIRALDRMAALSGVRQVAVTSGLVIPSPTVRIRSDATLSNLILELEI